LNNKAINVTAMSSKIVNSAQYICDFIGMLFITMVTN